MVRSEITGTMYNEGRCVFFRNPIQSCFYVLNGAKLVDIIPSTSECKFTYVFKREDHEALKIEWKNSSFNKNAHNNDDLENK